MGPVVLGYRRGNLDTLDGLVVGYCSVGRSQERIAGTPYEDFWLVWIWTIV